MRGLMMDRPLSIASLLQFAATNHGLTEIVSKTVEGALHAYTYRDCYRRVQRLANALRNLDISFGDRVGTLAWNGFRHFELYYATSGSGAVCHTINPQAFAGADPVHYQPCPRRIAVRRSRLRAAAGGHGRQAQGREGFCHHDGCRPHAADQPVAGPLLRGADRGRGRQFQLAAARRERGVLAVLQLRHHGRAEGHAVFASLDRAACVCRLPSRQFCLLQPRYRAAAGAVVPRQRLGRPLRLSDGRREAGVSRAESSTRRQSSSCWKRKASPMRSACRRCGFNCSNICARPATGRRR